MSNEAITVLKAVGDVSAVSVTVLTLLKIVPIITALFAIVWYSVALYEKITGQEFKDTRFARWITRK